MIKIFDNRDSFYQWDLNQKLIIEDSSITEVHFCNKTDNCSLVCEVYEEEGLRLVNVPNILLQNSWDIRVYAYCNNCYTKQAARFKVVPRSKPADYIYTETEIKTWESLADEVKNKQDKFAEVLHEESANPEAITGIKFNWYNPTIESNEGVVLNLNPIMSGINNTFYVSEPTDDGHAANKGYVDTKMGYVDTALENKQDKFATVIYGNSSYPEGTITGINFDFPWINIVTGGGGVKDKNGYYREGATLFLGEINASINKPLEIEEPTWEKHAATKGYVDTQIGDIETALENIIAKYGLGGAAV